MPQSIDICRSLLCHTFRHPMAMSSLQMLSHLLVVRQGLFQNMPSRLVILEIFWCSLWLFDIRILVPSPSHAGLRWHGSGCSACRSRLKQKGHATTNLISLWSLANKRGVFRVRGLQLCLPIDRIFSAFLDLTFAVSKSSFLLCDPNLACEKVLQFTICSGTVVISVERIKL